MSLFLASLFVSPVSAAPVVHGVQAQIHPAGFRFLSRELTGSTWAIAPTKVENLEFECYAIDITNANLELEFGEVIVSTGLNRLELDAQVVSAVGRDMAVRAVATGFPCVSFDAQMEEVALEDVRITGDLFPRINGDVIDVAFLEPLDIQGNATIDFLSIPDFVEQGLLLFLQGALLNFAENELEQQLPDLLASLTVDGFLYQSEFAGFTFGVTASSVTNTSEGLYAAGSIDLGGDGGDGELLDLSPRGESHIAVGLTEAMLEEVAVAAWDQGLITPDSEPIALLIDDLLASLGLGDGLAVQIGANAAPRVTVDAGGMAVALPRTTVSVTNPQGDVLLDLEADVEGLLELKVEAGSMLVTAHELIADVTKLEASALLEGGPENLRQFLQNWVVRAATAALDDLEIYQSHFEALGYVLRIDESQFDNDGVAAWMTLFAADDPLVDREAPDTTGQIALEGNRLRATYTGADDRPGPLVYSYRVNGGSWSAWSPDTEAEVTVTAGEVTFEVKSRDTWHNEDPTPAVGTLTYVPPRRRACGCASTPGSGVAWALGGLTLVAFARRRHPSARTGCV